MCSAGRVQGPASVSGVRVHSLSARVEHEGHAGDDRPAAWKIACCGEGMGTGYNVHIFYI